MNRKIVFFATGISLLFMASCQNGNNPKIEGKWQATLIDIPSQDSMMQSQMKAQMEQIDAITEVDSILAKRFGSTDLATVKASAKAELEKQPEQMKEQLKTAAAEFSFNLLKDGTALLLKPLGADTANWYFADNGKKLVIDPFERESNDQMGGGQAVSIFDIVYAGSDSLRLRVHQPKGQDVFINLRTAKASDKKEETKK